MSQCVISNLFYSHPELRHMNITVIISGGVGMRFASNLPKQYHLLCGKEIIAYVYEAVMNTKLTDKIVIVSAQPLEYDAIYVKSGETHNESVKNALDYIYKQYPLCEKVVFVDSVRPFISAGIIDEYFEILGDNDAVITAQHITDSLGKNGEQFVDRSEYFLIQKPEGFRFSYIYEYFKVDSEKTAIVQQLPKEASVFNCFKVENNLKITYPADLLIAEKLMEIRGVDH